MVAFSSITRITVSFLNWSEVMPKFAHLPLILRPDEMEVIKKRWRSFRFPCISTNWTNPETGENSSGYRERATILKLSTTCWLLGWNWVQLKRCLIWMNLLSFFFRAVIKAEPNSILTRLV